jgi:hypothetical protein
VKSRHKTAGLSYSFDALPLMWKREMSQFKYFLQKEVILKQLDSLKPFACKAFAFSGIPYNRLVCGC